MPGKAFNSRCVGDDMRTPRFYTNQPLAPTDSVTLEEETSHYMRRVLRLSNGDPLVLFNGDGKDYQAFVGDSTGKLVVVQVSEGCEQGRESNLRIELGQGISRGERMDFALQKSVELGVNCITPIWTTRSQVKLSGQRLEKRMTHWRAVMRSASEQSGRAVIPSLDDATTLPEWCSSTNVKLKLVLDPEASIHLSELATPSSVGILIGPEGGLASDEIRVAEANGFQRIRLGPRTLRTETAALAALAAAQFD